MDSKIKKIHIIGGAGSGKSFLAREISKDLKIRHYELDNLFWDNAKGTYGVKRDEEQRNHLLEEILVEDSWIIEGVYYAWLDQSFADADLIIVMCPHVWKQHIRVIRRFIKRKFGIELANNKESFSDLKGLLKWNHTYNREKIPVIMERILEYEDKIVMVKTAKEV
jgi:adenylate kinase family enzyme